MTLYTSPLAVLEQAKENVKASSEITSLVIDRGFLDGKSTGRP